MENTIQNKMAFFALYWGQKVMVNGSTTFEVGYLDDRNTEDYLELKSCENITPQDAYEVGKVVNCWSWRERKMTFFESDEMKEVHIGGGEMFAAAIGKEWGPGMSHPFANNSTDILNAYDILRALDYALPWRGLSVQEQVNYGWIRLK